MVEEQGVLIFLRPFCVDFFFFFFFTVCDPQSPDI